MSPRWFLVPLALCLLTAGVALRAAQPGSLPFVAELADPPPAFDGRVAEVVEVPGHTYLLVTAEGLPESQWVVSLSRRLLVGDTVHVEPFGQATDFRSERTGLSFDSLLFAIVRSVP